MARWVVIGIVSAAGSAAAAFVSSGPAREVLVTVAAATATLLASWGAKAEARVEEARERILKLSRDFDATALAAKTAQARADEPVWDRQIQERYETFVKPTDDAITRTVHWAAAFLRGASTRIS